MKTRPTGQNANVAASVVANDCPPPLVPLATDRHDEVFAAILGCLPADQRGLPSVRILAMAASGHVLALDAIQRDLEGQGTLVDGRPSRLLRNMTLVTRSLTSTLRCLKVLPKADGRTLANAAKLERNVRGGRDLTSSPVVAEVPAVEIDWIAVEAANRGAKQ